MKCDRNWLWALPATALLIISGCAETRLAREEKSAARQIDVAQEEGATPEALKAARGSLRFAQESEKRASEDLAAGKEDLEDAQARQRAARAVADERRGASVGADAQVVSAEQDLERAEARQAELRAKGLSEADVSAATSVEMSRARQRVASAKAVRETVLLEAPLAALEIEAARTAVVAAESRISSAEQRLDVARSLYRRSEAQAKSVEMEALAGKRAAIDGRLDGGK